MKNNHFNILIACIAFLNTSCVHYYYAPGSNNVPLFKEKNEMRIQAQYSTVGMDAISGEGIGGFELQTAYAAGNHLGLQLNYFYAGDSDPDYGSGNGNYIEAAAGYFKPSKDKKLIFESYGGIGRGSVKSVYKSEYINEYAKTSFTKFFVQPSFGFTSTYFSAALSSKFSLVKFDVKSSSLSPENNADDYKYIESFKHNKPYIWWEPGLLIRAGFKEMQLCTQITYSMHGDNAWPYCNLNYSVGIVFPFNIKSK